VKGSVWTRFGHGGPGGRFTEQAPVSGAVAVLTDTGPNPTVTRISAGRGPLLRRRRPRIEVGEGQWVPRRGVEDLLTADLEVMPHVKQLAGGDLSPPRVLVHPFAGHDDRGLRGQIARADADRAACAGVVEMASAAWTARRSLEHEQVVGFGIAQRPQL